jgi:endonuclease III
MTNAFIDVMKSETATLDKKMMATGKVQQVFNEQFNAEGFTEAAEKLVKESIKSIANIVSSSKNLKEMLANLLKNQNSFQYIHCQSIAFVADKVIDNMEWGSKEQKEKLNFIILCTMLFYKVISKLKLPPTKNSMPLA